jgi:hypothetical protein
VPVPTVIPNAPIITKVFIGKAVGTHKVFLQRNNKKTLVTASAAMQHKGTRYTVQTTLTPEIEASWVIKLEGVASTKIFLTDLVDAKNYIRVYGVNSAGKGQPSVPFPFKPQ